MRVCLELRHDVHPHEWSARHQRGEVPDRWPYGLDRLASYGVEPEFRRPLRGRVPMRAARALRAKGGGFEWLEGSATAFSPERGRADAIVCWDESNGVPAVIRERALRGVPVATGVIWLADDRLPRSVTTEAAQRALPQAALVWVLSSGMMPRLIDDWRIAPRRLHLVPMGIDADFFQPEAGPADPGLVVGAGNDRHRDHELLVKVMTEVHRRRPTARLELASRLPVEVPPAIGRRRTGVHTRDVAAMYRDATLVAVLTKPNLHASGLTVALEAMASGRPVVATDTPGLAEYVVEGETGLLVPAGDQLAAVEAIEALLADPERARALGEQGRRAVERSFTSEKQAERLAELIRELE